MKKQEFLSATTYTWAETRIYHADVDTVEVIKPQSENEIFHIVAFYGHPRLLKFYKGSQFLSECVILEEFEMDSIYCIRGSNCFRLNCGYDLCYQFYTLDAVVFYQFPFLEGNFKQECNTASLFNQFTGQFYE
jgi:hypothetical protein